MKWDLKDLILNPPRWGSSWRWPGIVLIEEDSTKPALVETKIGFKWTHLEDLEEEDDDEDLLEKIDQPLK